MNLQTFEALPFTHRDPTLHWASRGLWDAKWLGWGGRDPDHTLCAYKCTFTLTQPQAITLLVSADPLYRLYLDGKPVGLGPEVGTPEMYYFDRHSWELAPGIHCLVALVPDFQDSAAYWQMGLRRGFLAANADENAPLEWLNTGFAPWQVLALKCWRWIPTPILHPHVDFYGENWPEGLCSGECSGWSLSPVAETAANAGIRNEYPPERLLRPATLPPRYYRQQNMVTEVHAPDSDRNSWLKLFRGEAAFSIGPGQNLRVIGRLDDYHCVYPEIKTSNGRGAKISLGWAESLYSCDANDRVKGRRDQVDSKIFRSCYDRQDIFRPYAGEMTFFTPWWRAGRFFELTVTTAEEALTLESFQLFDTRYPLESEQEPLSDDPRLNHVLQLCFRTLQMCTHDTYMDCPYYEQLMYVGDGRLEALVTLASTDDDRMVRKMLELFAASQQKTGFLYSRYPSRVCQIIPPFSLLWIASLHDYAMMRSDKKFVSGFIGCVQKIIAAFEAKINPDGLLAFDQGWNFMDWTPNWNTGILRHGTPPGAEYGVSPVLNWLYVYALKLTSQLCEYVGMPEAGDFYQRRAREVAVHLLSRYWNEDRGILVETIQHDSCCEHSHCLAVLSGELPPEIETRIAQTLFATPEMDRTSISFSHYYFECCRKLKRIDALWKRMQLWFDCLDLGLATLLEEPEPSRSDCHGWSSHPYYHVAATLGGIRPAGFEFHRVTVEPQLGYLKYLRTGMCHPQGKIKATYSLEEEGLVVELSLPGNLTGQLLYGSFSCPLASGINHCEIPHSHFRPYILL